MEFQCSFNLNFPDGLKMSNIFFLLLAICISSFEKCLFSSLAYISIGLFGVVCFDVEFFEFFSYPGYYSSIRRVAGEDFLSFCRLSLHALVFSAVWKLFNLMPSHLLILAIIS